MRRDELIHEMQRQAEALERAKAELKALDLPPDELRARIKALEDVLLRPLLEEADEDPTP